MELEPLFFFPHHSVLLLLHYSYMELELFFVTFNISDIFYYIIPIWNWSSMNTSYLYLMIPDYIIHIWNWSWGNEFDNRRDKRLHYSYMELELTCCTCFCINTFITLFLYGIGADVSKITTSEFFIITLFLYGIGAGVAFTMIQRMYVITLFLYGIGAKVIV